MRPVTIRQCAVLAGGLGSRLGDLATTTPKPILPCGDRPFLAWLLREFIRFGVEEFVLLTGHLSDRLRESVAAIAAALPRQVSIVVSEEPVRAGTGGAMFHAKEMLDSRFLFCNGDSLFDFNLAALLAAAARDPAEVVGRIVLRQLDDASRYGVVEIAGEVVRAFRERPDSSHPAPGTINAGVYQFDRRVLEHVSPVCSLERDVLPVLAARGQLRGTQAAGHFIDIGIPDDLARAQRELPGWLRRPSLFFDRDVLVKVGHNGAGASRHIEWTPGAPEAVRRAVCGGWHVFVVSGQSCAARGFHDQTAVREQMQWVTNALHAAGGTIDDWRDTATTGIRPDPALGMLLDLIEAWGLDAAQAVMIGSTENDMRAAAAAGMRGMRFTGGDLGAVTDPILSGPGFAVPASSPTGFMRRAI